MGLSYMLGPTCDFSPDVLLSAVSSYGALYILGVAFEDLHFPGAAHLSPASRANNAT